jgi:hyperosmotically inducible protein
MNKRTGSKILLLVGLAVLLLGLTGSVFASVPKPVAPSLTDQVRHELLMLPYYGVFDDLSFTIDSSNTVILSGKVTRPILKSDAEATVRSIPGIRAVVNNIEVLPLSPFDNKIRRDMLWAIYSRPGFEKYATQADPPIKIIVENGNVTLDGVVGSQLDRQLAEMAARSVSGVFSVTDNLKVS